MLTEGHGIQTASPETVPAEPDEWSPRSGRKPFPAAGLQAQQPRGASGSPCSGDAHQMDGGPGRRQAIKTRACTGNTLVTR